MTKQAGYSLIELVIFIAISSILAATILLSLGMNLRATPAQHNNYIAFLAARACLDGMLAQRAIYGWSLFPCPSTTAPTYCTAPANDSIAVTTSCTTKNSDTTYKTISVVVTGLGSATMTALIANY